MNIPVLIVATVMALSVVAHVVGGTGETAHLAPAPADKKRSALLVPAICAFQMLGVDLAAVTGLLFTIALTDVLAHEALWIQAFGFLLLAWGCIWVVQMIWVHDLGPRPRRVPHAVAAFSGLVRLYGLALLGGGAVLGSDPSRSCPQIGSQARQNRGGRCPTCPG